MNGVPVGWLLTIAVVATVVAALLSAGETAVLRSSPSGAVIPEKLGAAARRRRLLADAHGTAGAAAGVGVVCQVIAAVSLTVALMGTGLAWWLVLLAALVLVGVLALVVVRFLPRTLGYRYPGVTLLLTGAGGGLVGRRRAGRAVPEGRRPPAAHRRRRHLACRSAAPTSRVRPGVQAGRRAAPGDAAGRLAHGHGGRRVRRDRRPGDDLLE